MKRFWSFLSDALGLLWFFGILLWALLLLVLAVLIFIPFMDIKSMLDTGFSTATAGLSMYGFLAILFAITGLFPPFRKCYVKLPWLYPLVIIFMADLFLLGAAEEILSAGFSIMDTSRHTLFLFLMAAELIAGRLLMCWYFHRHPFGNRGKR